MITTFLLLQIFLLSSTSGQTSFNEGLERSSHPYYNQIPSTGFSCENQQWAGYYSDQEADCQVFHICIRRQNQLEQFSFLCPNETVFHQQLLVCVWWGDFDCSSASSFYYINEGIFEDQGIEFDPEVPIIQGRSLGFDKNSSDDDELGDPYIQNENNKDISVGKSLSSTSSLPTEGRALILDGESPIPSSKPESSQLFSINKISSEEPKKDKGFKPTKTPTRDFSTSNPSVKRITSNPPIKLTPEKKPFTSRIETTTYPTTTTSKPLRTTISYKPVTQTFNRQITNSQFGDKSSKEGATKAEQKTLKTFKSTLRKTTKTQNQEPTPILKVVDENLDKTTKVSSTVSTSLGNRASQTLKIKDFSGQAGRSKASNFVSKPQKNKLRQQNQVNRISSRRLVENTTKQNLLPQSSPKIFNQSSQKDNSKRPLTRKSQLTTTQTIISAPTPPVKYSKQHFQKTLEKTLSHLKASPSPSLSPSPSQRPKVSRPTTRRRLTKNYPTGKSSYDILHDVLKNVTVIRGEALLNNRFNSRSKNVRKNRKVNTPTKRTYLPSSTESNEDTSDEFRQPNSSNQRQNRITLKSNIAGNQISSVSQNSGYLPSGKNKSYLKDSVSRNPLKLNRITKFQENGVPLGVPNVFIFENASLPTQHGLSPPSLYPFTSSEETTSHENETPVLIISRADAENNDSNQKKVYLNTIKSKEKSKNLNLNSQPTYGLELPQFSGFSDPTPSNTATSTKANSYLPSSPTSPNTSKASSAGSYSNSYSAGFDGTKNANKLQRYAYGVGGSSTPKNGLY